MSIRVLIVDDDMPTVEAIRASVRWKRFGVEEVMTAYNVEQARCRLLETGADIVISDIEMPKGSGLELLEWYREQGMEGEFLLLTCHERFDYALNAVKLRASEFLLKPFDVGAMEAALEKLAAELAQRRSPADGEAASEAVPEAAGGPAARARSDAPSGDVRAAVFDLDRLESLLEEQNKLEYLSYIKQCLAERARDRLLDGTMLHRMRRELLQSVYTYLGKRELSISGLIACEPLNALEEKAVLSATDFIRWANNLAETAFYYEEEMRKHYRLSDKIDRYIEQHYAEDISRREIAAAFYLAPEYISKIYKRETGVNLNDAIAQCRIAQARIRLDRGARVGDVAMEVGFKDFTYFSTTFKKYTGITPNQYRKHEKG